VATTDETPEIPELKRMAKERDWDGDYWIQQFGGGKRGGRSYGRFRVHKKFLGVDIEWINPPTSNDL
jgi:hypothetical protein